MDEPVSVTTEIAASPARLYAMIADLPRMGEWSPENRGGVWLGGAAAAAPGVRFRGRNRNGIRSWRTVARILEAEPGRRFSFRVSVGPVPVSQWGYTFEAAPTGSRVTESWQDLRPRWFRPIASLATGVGDRPTHNRRAMEQTLDRLRAASELPGRHP